LTARLVHDANGLHQDNSLDHSQVASPAISGQSKAEHELDEHEANGRPIQASSSFSAGTDSGINSAVMSTASSSINILAQQIIGINLEGCIRERASFDLFDNNSSLDVSEASSIYASQDNLEAAEAKPYSHH
jgi:hypothetical protein